MLVFSKKKFIDTLKKENAKEMIDVSVRLGFLNYLEGKPKTVLESQGWNLMDDCYIESST